MSKGHKKQLKTSRNKRTGKYAEQRIRTEANKLRRKQKLLDKGLFSCYVVAMIALFSLSSLYLLSKDGVSVGV